MKINIVGNVNPEQLKTILEKQIQKKNIIDEFCKDNKLKEFIYKDSELEYNINIVKKSQGGAKDE